MQKLLAGYHRFRSKNWLIQQQRFESLAAHGQAPRIMVVACIDSRVDPGMIFDVGPGEILTVRNVANLVPPYSPDSSYHGTSAAIEFGVRVLGVPNLIVLGHGHCGGVRTLLDGRAESSMEFVPQWMSIAQPARQRAMQEASHEQRERCCEHEVVKVSLANLRSFPWVAEREAAGTLKLHGAWFEVGTGLLMLLDAQGRFSPVNPEVESG